MSRATDAREDAFAADMAAVGAVILTAEAHAPRWIRAVVSVGGRFLARVPVVEAPQSWPDTPVARGGRIEWTWGERGRLAALWRPARGAARAADVVREDDGRPIWRGGAPVDDVTNGGSDR